MSGKRQHYIPQFLQTGFLSKTDGETNFTIVYRKGMHPKEISTRHVGVETHFYNKPDNTFLDDLITEAESTRYTKTMSSLRNGSNVKPSLVEGIARLISHFQIRSRNLRLSLIEATNPIVDMVIEEFNDPSLQIEFLKHLARTQPEVDPMVVHLLDDPDMARLVAPSISEFFNNREFFENTMKGQSKIVHQTELKNSIEPKKHIKHLKKLCYQIVDVKEFPLGDSMTIFCVKNNGKKYWKTILSKGDKLDYVALPISTNKLLIGSTGNTPTNYDEIRDGIIECSYEFFISSSISPKLEKGISNIGNNSNLISDEELEYEMRKLRRSFGISEPNQ